MATIRDVLPPPHARLLPELFDRPAPAETRATCSNCAMCPPPGASAEGPVSYFRPDTKCCTFHPSLPSYLVGALLADPDPALAEGRARVRRAIAGRRGVLPRFLEAPKRYRLLLRASREASFGRSAVLRCPYYEPDGGQCTIWRHREADCSTFFCKYDAGADGQAFWRALDGWLRTLERALAAHAQSVVAPELPRDDEDSDTLTLEELEERAPDPVTYARLWGAWEGREEAFYLRCHEVIASLDAAEVRRLGGDALAEIGARLAIAHDAASATALPPRLVLSPRVGLRDVPGGTLAVGYSRYEPTLLSADLLAVLRELRADETVTGFRARMLADEEVDVPEELLVALYRQRIVEEPASAGRVAEDVRGT